MVTAMLTTVDNPYDPVENFAAWYAWDVSHGYNTSAYLARVLVDAEEAPGPVRDRQVEQAIDEIIEAHEGEIYKKVFEEIAA